VHTAATAEVASGGVTGGRQGSIPHLHRAAPSTMHTSRRTYTVHHHVQSWFRGEGGNGDFTEQQLHHRDNISATTGARAA
jgi:hypothetical protein